MNKLFESSLDYYLSDLITQIGEESTPWDNPKVATLLRKIQDHLEVLNNNYDWVEDEAKADEIDSALSCLWGQLNLSAEPWSVNKLTGIEKALNLHKKK